MPVLHAVDGTFELFRAHFSKRPGHTGPDGKPLKATVGVAASLLALLEAPYDPVTHVAVAFDNPIRSFRNDLYAGYKSDEGMDPELRAQFDDVERAVAALGVTVWSMDHWETDDALATAAWRWGAQGEVRILSPDKDFGQCLGWPGVSQFDRIRERRMTADDVRETRGVEPESIPDLLALTGDSADGIPGLPGWGAKSSSTVLARWRHVDAIPDDPAAWEVKVRGADGLAATLRERREDARLFRQLATLVTDVPLPQELDDLRWRGVPRDAWVEWCRSVGVRWENRPSRWRAD